MSLAPTLMPLTWPPARVDVTVDLATLQAMIQRVEANFRHMGETDPHWSVLTDERFRAANIANTEAEFYESGREPVDELIITLERCGINPRRFRTCFELGCGLGRSTIWLAERFPVVIGSDISAPHLAIAAEAARRRKCKNVQFQRFDRVNSIADGEPFDLFFSIIVLQHNPPPVIRAILAMVFNRLPSGGVAYFQVPTYRFGYSFDANAYLASKLRIGEAEMHALPQPELHELIAASGCRIVEIREDGAASGFNVSNRVLVRKL